MRAQIHTLFRLIVHGLFLGLLLLASAGGVGAQEDCNWDPGFESPGPDGAVYAIAFFDEDGGGPADLAVGEIDYLVL